MQVTERLLKAVDTAALAHSGQRRKGGPLPYIVHPFGAMLFASEMTDDEDVLIAVLLHDVIEDVPDKYSADDIERDFGAWVRQLVQDVTQDPSQPTWRACKEAYLAHLRSASAEAVMVALADKLHNISSILSDYVTHGEDLWQRFNSSEHEQLWFYSTFAALAKEQLGNTPMIQRYTAEVDRLRQIIQSQD